MNTGIDFPGSKRFHSAGFRPLLVCLLLVLLGGCTPRLESPDPKERLRAVQRPQMIDQSVLARVALDDTDPTVRLAAVGKLSDQVALADVALRSADPAVCLAAVGKLSGQAALAGIAARSADPAVCLAAVGKLGDQAALADIAIGGTDPTIGCAAVEKLTDQGLLAKVAAEDTQPTVRVAAASRLNLATATDRAAFTKVAAEDRDPRVRNAAARLSVAHLGDQAALAEIAEARSESELLQALQKHAGLGGLKNVEYNDEPWEDAGHWDLQSVAVEKLADRDALARIAARGRKEPACAAVERLTRQSILAKAAIETFHQEVTEAAVAKLTDQSLLAQVALRGHNGRSAAVAKLTDPALLARVAVEGDSWIRLCAVETLSDPVALARIAARDKDAQVRSVAAAVRLKVAMLNDPGVLARVATSAEYYRTDADGFNDDCEIRLAAIRRLSDQALLAEIAGSKELERCPDGLQEAVARLTDEAALVKLVLGADVKDYVRNAAVRKLTEQTLLAKVAVEADDRYLRGAAAAKLTDPALLARVAAEDEDMKTRLTAVETLADPKYLVRTAVSEADPVVRSIALLKVAQDQLLQALARSEKNVTVRTTAILLLKDQSRLQQLAKEDPMAAVREAAVVGVDDDAFLLRCADEDPSPTVRLAAVRALHETRAVLAAAQNGYHQGVREAALIRLTRMGNTAAAEVARASQRELNRQVQAFRSGSGSSAPLEEALHGRFDTLRLAAAERLNAAADLKRVATASDDREVLKSVFRRLADLSSLDDIAGTAVDPAVRLAAAVKAGRQSWDSVFRAAGGNAGPLGEALAAVALFKDVDPEAKAAVEETCLKMIELGDESRIPEMVDLLNLYGNERLCEDYLNCGQPDLCEAGGDWASRHGYRVGSSFGGSRRASWGSGR
jgi:hypothetical protein